MRNTTLRHNQSGIAHIGLLVLGLVVIGLVSFAGYRVYSNHQDSIAMNTTTPSDLPTVSENDDTTGEVKPPADTTPDTPADIQGDNVQ